MNVWLTCGIALLTGVLGFLVGINSENAIPSKAERSSSLQMTKFSTKSSSVTEKKTDRDTVESNRISGQNKAYRDSLEIISLMAGPQMQLDQLRFYAEISPEETEELFVVEERALSRLKILEQQHSEAVVLESGEEAIKISAFTHEYDLLVSEVESEIEAFVSGPTAVAAFNIIQSKFGDRQNIGHYDRTVSARVGSQQKNSYILSTIFHSADGGEEKKILRRIVGYKVPKRYDHLFDEIKH